MPSNSSHDLNSAFQNLAQSVKALSVTRFDQTAALQILQQWQKLAKSVALNGNVATLKLLISLLRTLLPIYPEWEIFLHQYAGTLALLEGLYGLASKSFERQLAEARQLQNPAYVVQAQIALAEAWLPQNQFAQAETLLKEAFASSYQHRFYLDYIRALNRIARLCYVRRHWENGYGYSKKVLELIRTYPDKQSLAANQAEIELEEAFALHWIGCYNAVSRQWHEATRYLEASLDARHHHRDLLGIVETLLKVGVVYQQLGQPDKALTCCEGSLAICQQLHNLPLALQAYYYKATTYHSLGRDQEALAPAKTALEIGLPLKQPEWLACAYFVLGRVCERLGDQKSSLTCYLQAIKLYQTSDDNPQWIEILIGVGDDLLAQRARPELWVRALTCFKQATNLIESNQQLEYLAPALGKIARAFLKVQGLQGVDEAIRCYRLQLRLAGDLESSVLSLSEAVALRVEALTGIQCCASLKINPNFPEVLDKLVQIVPSSISIPLLSYN